MLEGELFNNRYGEILAAIEATPGVSNMELAQAFGLSYTGAPRIPGSKETDNGK